MTKYKADIIKNRLTALCVCTLMAILSMVIYSISDKYYEPSAPVVATLSSEQLEETYDSDLWEDGDETYSYSFNRTDTETVSVINFPVDINIAAAEELTNIKGIGISTSEKIVDMFYDYRGKKRVRITRSDGKVFEGTCDGYYEAEDSKGNSVLSIGIENYLFLAEDVDKVEFLD